MNNLIILATYWNEIEWIEASLAQIERLNPIEVIICDGNFDSGVPNYSTDGTREIIQDFVCKNKDRAKMVSAVRSKSISRGLDFALNAGLKGEFIRPSRINYALRSQFLMNEYRVNQALTFSKMMNLSEKWEVGRWVMSYDADQFYTDELIDFFKITSENTEYDLITADEWTFPHDFDYYTENYELRKWNNMPHRIKKNMAVYPTRHFMVEGYLNSYNYQDNFKSIHGGVYHHYKFRKNLDRLNAGYNLGDRKPPNPDRYLNLVEFNGDYPESVRNRK